MTTFSDSCLKITVVIPTRNRAQLLSRAIKSVLAQTYQDFVIKVFDNASDDDTAKVVKCLNQNDARIEYFCNSNNIGPVRNMQNGVRSVDTDLYLVLNDDDFLLPSFFSLVINALEINSEAQFVCGKTVIADVKSNTVYFRNGDWVPGIHYPCAETVTAMYNSHFITTGVVFRKNVRDSVGEFEAGGSDRLYMTIAAAKFPFVVLVDNTSVLTVHPETYSSRGGIGKQERSSLIYQRYIESLAIAVSLKISDELKVLLVSYISNSYMSVLEYKKIRLNFLQNKQLDKTEESLALPPRINVFQVIDRLFETTPPFVHPLLKNAILLIKAIINYRKKRFNRKTELQLEHDAKKFLQGDDDDINPLLSSLNKLKSKH